MKKLLNWIVGKLTIIGYSLLTDLLHFVVYSQKGYCILGFHFSI